MSGERSFIQRECLCQGHVIMLLQVLSPCPSPGTLPMNTLSSFLVSRTQNECYFNDRVQLKSSNSLVSTCVVA